MANADLGELAQLRASDAKYRALLDRMDEGFAIIERVPGDPADFRWVEGNRAFFAQAGRDDLIGKTLREVYGDDLDAVIVKYDAILRTGHAERFEHTMPKAGYTLALHAFRSDSGPNRVAVLFLDVTERRRAETVLRESEERQSFLLKLSDALRPITNDAEMKSTAVRLLGEQLGVDRVFFASVAPNEQTWSVQRDYSRAAPSLAGQYTFSDYQRKRLPQWREGRMSSVDDSVTDARLTAEDRAAYAALDARAAIGVPLVKDGRFAALLVANQSTPRAWTDAELLLTREVAERIWAALTRARAEAALLERERQLALAVDIGAIGHWAYDLATGELTSSAICRRNFGRPQDAEFTYDELVASIHPDDRERQERAVAAAAESHTPLHIEYRVITPAGEVRWIEVRGQFVDGGKDRLIGVSQDITDRKRAEAMLRDSEQRQRLMLQLVPALLWRADPTGQKIELNESWNDFTGQSPAEVQNFGWLDAIHPDDLPEVRAAFEHAFATGEPLEREHRIRRADGDYRWHLVRHIPVRDESGAITRWFGAAIDIHDMKLARQALDDSEKWLQTLMQGVPQLVWRAMDGGHWTWASPQWTAYTHQPEPESHDWGWLEPVHPDDRERVRAIWAGAIDHGGFAADYRILHADENRYRWFQTRATPVRDATGAIVEWLGTSTDVDDIRELQRRQELLVTELQHRVRNILTVVRAVFTRTVEAGGEPDDMEDHFRGRLDALARTQVVMTRNAEGNADLENLIRDELLSVGVSDGPRVTIDGPDVMLPAKTVESIGLAIHELTTNALKYGALKVPRATLDIHWAIKIGYGGERRLTLTWHEQGVPAIAVRPARRGFGSELITEALPYRLGAETKLEFLGGGICCTIDVPLPEFDGPTEAS